MKRGLVSIAIILFLSNPHPIFGDPMPLSAGAALQPMTNTNVAIVKEDLSIELSYERIAVHASFTLQNQGKATSFPVGFPCEPHNAEVAGMTCRDPLRITVKGRSVLADRKVVKALGECWVWAMHFEDYAQIPMEIDYSAKIVNERYQIPLGGIFLTYYRLKTGKNWAGPIGKLTVQVKTPVETIIQVAPSGYNRRPGIIEWQFRNWEPDEDLMVVFNPMFTSRYIYRGLKSKASGDTGKHSIDRENLLKLAESFQKGMAQHKEHLTFQQQMLKWLHPIPSQGFQDVVRSSCEMMRKIADGKD